MFAQAASPSTGLKRARSVVNATSNSEISLPELPKITGEIILDVFTHRSLRPLSQTHAHGDNERLGELGRQVVEAVVTHALFSKKPFLKAKEIVTLRKEIICDANVEKWITMYRMREKLRCHPSAVASLHTPEEARLLFNSYVGAVYVEGGFGKIRQWIGRLADLEPPEVLSATPSPQAHESPPSKKVKNEEISPILSTLPPRLRTPHAPPICTSESPSSLPPATLVPTSSTNLPNPLAPAQPDLPFLPLFNQSANQRGVLVEYTSDFSGPSHSGKWTVRCVEVGIGHGTNKQIAKEAAARNAFSAMGWAPHG